MKTLILVSLILIAGCTNAEKSRFNAYGKQHSVQLWSGGQRVQEWTSTGKVLSEENSDGYYFQDSETKRLVRVSGDLVISPVE